MRKIRSTSNRVSLLGWTLLAFAAAAAGIWTVAWHGGAGKAPVTDGIVVVEAPEVALDESVPSVTMTPPPAPERPSSEVAAIHVRQAYPMLSDATIECDIDRCTLRGTIRPPAGQADLDKRQEMLLGGLAAVLAADGYRLVVPFQMDEIDDNEFLIRASVMPAYERAP